MVRRLTLILILARIAAGQNEPFSDKTSFGFDPRHAFVVRVGSLGLRMFASSTSGSGRKDFVPLVIPRHAKTRWFRGSEFRRIRVWMQLFREDTIARGHQ